MCIVTTDAQQATTAPTESRQTPAEDLRTLPVDGQNCPTCGAAVPLQNVTDKVFRRRVTKEPRRVLRLDCDACGRGHVVRFGLAGRGWRAIGGVKVIEPSRPAPAPAVLARAMKVPRTTTAPSTIATSPKRRRRAG